MDTDRSSVRTAGGSVEPLDRTAVLKAQFRIPDLPGSTRYELRDPFAEVTYRSASLEDMTQKADRLGAVRFTAVDPAGNRTPVKKIAGAWEQQDRTLSQTSLNAARDEHKGPAHRSNVPAASTRAGPAPEQADSTAAQRARASKIEAELNERYVVRRAPLRIGAILVGQSEYRYRGDPSRTAFTEATFRLTTDTNNSSVVRSMVDAAEARGWTALRVSGNEQFRRAVWLESSARQIHAVGYEPVAADREALQHALHGARHGRSGSGSAVPSGAADKQSARGGGSRKSVLVALEAVLVSKHVPEEQRQAVMAAARDNLARRLARNESHRVKVYDSAAPSRARPVAPSVDRDHTRSRNGPMR